MAPPIVADPPDETDAQTGREAHYPLAGGIGRDELWSLTRRLRHAKRAELTAVTRFSGTWEWPHIGRALELYAAQGREQAAKASDLSERLTKAWDPRYADPGDPHNFALTLALGEFVGTMNNAGIDVSFLTGRKPKQFERRVSTMVEWANRPARLPVRRGGIATRSTRTRTITRCATSTKTSSSGASGGGGDDSGGGDTGGGEPPRLTPPRFRGYLNRPAMRTRGGAA